MTLPELGLVVLQFCLMSGTGWVLGSLALRRAFDDDQVGLPERALAAVGAFVVLATGLMVLHIVSGGLVFGNAFVVPLVGIVVFALGRKREVWWAAVPWKRIAPAVLLLLALFVVPVFAAGSSVREGDPPWHMGWTYELLDGQPLPDGPAPDFGRNAYPWGWHGVLATATRLVPGSTPLLAHEALHILLVLAIPLSVACIARRVRKDAGWFAAGAGTLIAGFGWITARDFDFVASPTEARFGADMVVASPNSVYELFAPALPREMGLVLLAVAGTLMLLALRNPRPVRWYVAGTVAGCAALVSFPMLIPALLWSTVCALLARGARVATWFRLVVPIVALFALWLGPLVYWYLTEGGFVDVVPVLGVEWPLLTAVASWGLLLPLAIAGAALLARDRSIGAVAVLGFTFASVASILLAVARREFDWTLQGNQTLFHQGRMWPVAHLLGAALAGLALAHLHERLRERDPKWARGTVVGILLVGSISLLLSIPSLTSLVARGDKGFVYGDEDVASGSFVRQAAAHLSPDDVVVAGDNGLAFKLFEFSGVSLGEYDDPRLEGNEVRIRYRDLAERYIERMRTGGFTPSHVVVEDGAPRVPGEALEEGEYRGRDWVLVAVEGGS